MIAPLLALTVFSFRIEMLADAVNRFDWYQYKPIAWVIKDLKARLDAEFSDEQATAAHSALNQLTYSWWKGELSDKESDEFFELLLTEQEAEGTLAVPRHNVLIELDQMMASRRESVRPEHLHRYFENLRSVDLHSRSVVAIGRLIPIRVDISDNVSRVAMYYSCVQPRTVLLNGVDPPIALEWRYDRELSAFFCAIPAAVEGNTDIMVELSIIVFRKGEGPSDAGCMGKEPVYKYARWLHARSRVVQVAACPEVRTIPIEPRWSPSGSAAVGFRASPMKDDPGCWLLDGHVRLAENYPADLACQVFAVLGDTVVSLHDTWYSRNERARMLNAPALHIWGELLRRPPDRIGLILKTKKEVAYGTVDIQVSADVEYRLRDVPVNAK